MKNNIKVFSLAIFILILISSSDIKAQKIYYQTQGRLTSKAELIKGAGISIIISGPEIVSVNEPSKFSIEIKPGKEWTTQNGAFGKPRKIMGSGMSQIVIAGNSNELKLSNPKLFIDGRTTAEEIILGLLTSTYPVSELAASAKDILPIISKILLESFSKSVNSTYKADFTSEFIGIAPDLGQLKFLEHISARIGGKKLSDIDNAQKIKLEIDVIFKHPGEASFFILPDIRAEALGKSSNNNITTTVPVLFEYREGIMIRIKVEDEQLEDFNKFLRKFFNDKTFQRQRIVFPLEGGSYIEEERGEINLQKSLIWKESDWKFINYELRFKNDLSIEQIINLLSVDYDDREYYVCKISDDRGLKKLIYFIKQYSPEDDANYIYSVEFHYKLRGNKWYLVYYIPEILG